MEKQEKTFPELICEQWPGGAYMDPAWQNGPRTIIVSEDPWDHELFCAAERFYPTVSLRNGLFVVMVAPEFVRDVFVWHTTEYGPYFSSELTSGFGPEFDALDGETIVRVVAAVKEADLEATSLDDLFDTLDSVCKAAKNYKVDIARAAELCAHLTELSEMHDVLEMCTGRPHTVQV